MKGDEKKECGRTGEKPEVVDDAVRDVEERGGERLGIREDRGRDFDGMRCRKRRENRLHTTPQGLVQLLNRRSGDSVVA